MLYIEEIEIDIFTIDVATSENIYLFWPLVK